MEDLQDFFGNMGDTLGSGEQADAVEAPRFRRQPPPQQPTFDPRYAGVRRPARGPGPGPAVRRVPPPPQEEFLDEEPFEQPGDSSLPLHEPRSEAEARLHQARYFEVLLANAIFPQANSQGQYVEQRLRQWAENELAILLGMRPSHDLAPFTPKQIITLRAIANKLLSQSAVKEDAVPPPKETAPVPRPPAATPAPQPVRRRPLIRRDPAPAPMQEQEEPEVEVPPLRRPPPARSSALIPSRKPVAKRRAPAPPPRPKQRGAPRPPMPTEIDEDTLQEGEVIESGVKKYKITLGTDEKGNRKVIYQDVTPAATVESAPPTPMPDSVQLEHVTAMQAATQVEKAMKGSRALQRAVAAAQNT